MDEPTKKCNECGIVKPISKFHNNARNKDGYHSKCKSCRKILDSKNPKKVQQYIDTTMCGLNARDY